MAERPIKIGYVIASKRVSEDRQPVLYMYREVPDSDIDSGWRVFAGTEDQAYAEVAENFAMYNCSTILELDPSIASYLDFPPGTAFERDDGDSPFQQIPFVDHGEA